MSWDSGSCRGGEDNYERNMDNAAWDRTADWLIRNDPLAPTVRGYTVDVLSARIVYDTYRKMRRTRDLVFATSVALLLLMPVVNMPVLFLPTMFIFFYAVWLSQRSDVSRARGRRLAAVVIEAERQAAPDARIGGR